MAAYPLEESQGGGGLPVRVSCDSLSVENCYGSYEAGAQDAVEDRAGGAVGPIAPVETGLGGEDEHGLPQDHAQQQQALGSASNIDAGVTMTSISVTSLLAIFSTLSRYIKRGFEESAANQLEIRNYCESLVNKIHGLTSRTGKLEESVSVMSIHLDKAEEDIVKLKKEDQALLDRKEVLENNARRSNIRILNVPEGSEGSDVKQFITHLLKDSLCLDQTLEELATDIQMVHRDPFRRNPQRSKPRKILLIFIHMPLKS